MNERTRDRPSVEIVRGHTVAPRDPRGTREGYTTGATAAAATEAACRLLAFDERPESIAVRSPSGFDIVIKINRLRYQNDIAIAGAIKDAGDDPDVTHGAEILATVRRTLEPGIAIRGGAGVGVVTRRGLELPPGEPAINPVPRKMITNAIVNVFGAIDPRPGVETTIAIPNGESLAKRTLNERIGIVGGLSILGTTGIVKPMSTASWRASVVQAIDVAAANNRSHIVLTTGGRTERFAESLFPELDETAFVQMGIFTGDALKRCALRGAARATICGMIGKLAKIAAGQMQTHVAGGEVDVDFLAEIARESQADPSLVEAIKNANTGRHVQDLIQESGLIGFYEKLADRAASTCFDYVSGVIEIAIVLFDFDGAILARTLISKS